MLNAATQELFATKIVIEELLNIEHFEIPLSETERKHLIITGKNGSGKTMLLGEIRKFFVDLTNHDTFIDDSLHPIIFIKNSFRRSIDKLVQVLLNSRIKIDNEFHEGKFLLKFFSARRDNLDREMVEPIGPKKLEEKVYYAIDEKINQNFIQFLFNSKADAAFAKMDERDDESKVIDLWFKRFEKSLFELFDIEGAVLQFDNKHYRFYIIEQHKPPYSLSELPDGFYAVLDIVSELLMRMHDDKTGNYDIQGIVLIDEIETHLHIALQKKILPFLTSFFPRIQFIVTTHSPFVISSISNAVICDLERKTIETDYSAYSYEAIVENYFDIDKYSEKIKKEVAEFEELMSKADLNIDEQARLAFLKDYMYKLQGIASDELAVKIQQIRLKQLNPNRA